MDSINNLLKKRLQKTFQNYFKHSIEHLVVPNKTENDILQIIINIQASLELLVKLYILNRLGWKEIVTNKFHSKTILEIQEHIADGTLKTNNYTNIKKALLDLVELDDSSKELLISFQNYRNQVMHLGAEELDTSILDEVILFIVKIINILNWQDTLPSKHQYLANSLELLLGDVLYTKLITQSTYIDEAIDSTYESFDDVRYCFSCSNMTLVANKWDDEYKCLVCGCQISNDGSTKYFDCIFCDRKGTVIYDALNISNNTSIDGLCCACGEYVNITQCKSCKNIYSSSSECDFCNS